MITLIKPLIVNITIIFSLTFNANLFFPFHRGKKISLKQKIIYGLLSAFAGLLCMSYPVEVLGETNFDFRMIMILVITLYGGFLPGLICTVIILIGRIFLVGGNFASVGVIVCILAFIISMLFRSTYIRATNKLLFAVLVLSCYLLSYIFVIYQAVDFLDTKFYIIYFSSFTATFFFLIVVIERLIHANKRLDEDVYLDKLSTVGQMAASFAHEIRNPITTVRGFIQFLEKETTDRRLKQYSPLILEELDRTNEIITNYLTLAKPEKIKLEPVCLNVIIEKSVELIRPLASYHDVDLVIKMSEEYEVFADSNHLKQVFLNLIKNGVESIEKGGCVFVATSKGEKKGTVQVIIEDNGKGMTPKQLKKMGLPYYTTKTKGTGLGSMISNRLIREMNGNIQYSSALNEGTKVIVTLPLHIKK
ncbi:ATP-binding protein [Bacillus salitolerans]|uniref:histidine kinase n=1 Tax=Bacillus salitolerans TaxID=1437434 RepID=A0ABW4LK69_9BACI